MRTIAVINLVCFFVVFFELARMGTTAVLLNLLSNKLSKLSHPPKNEQAIKVFAYIVFYGHKRQVWLCQITRSLFWYFYYFILSDAICVMCADILSMMCSGIVLNALRSCYVFRHFLVSCLDVSQKQIVLTRCEITGKRKDNKGLLWHVSLKNV